jgi:hypothetical protein
MIPNSFQVVECYPNEHSFVVASDVMIIQCFSPVRPVGLGKKKREETNRPPLVKIPWVGGFVVGKFKPLQPSYLLA